MNFEPICVPEIEQKKPECKSRKVAIQKLGVGAEKTGTKTNPQNIL